MASKPLLIRTIVELILDWSTTRCEDPCREEAEQASYSNIPATNVTVSFLQVLYIQEVHVTFSSSSPGSSLCPVSSSSQRASSQ